MVDGGLPWTAIVEGLDLMHRGGLYCKSKGKVERLLCNCRLPAPGHTTICQESNFNFSLSSCALTLKIMTTAVKIEEEKDVKVGKRCTCTLNNVR